MITVIKRHKHKLLVATLLVTFGFALSNCYDSTSEAPMPRLAPPPLLGLATNGQIYYQNRCGTCHSAGRDDITTAYGAVDLARRHDMIAIDISNFDQTSGFNMMRTFKDIPKQRVADLKAYLKSVPVL